ncbi:DUF4215 domain-containing protein [Candidatus Woesearchaeota archaeon]|nr:DUF4215 domain-containing protein [Candidatus Woesearchaeota archaeon]
MKPIASFGQMATGAVLADFDNDSDLDLATAYGNDNTIDRHIRIFRNNGTGTFTNLGEINGVFGTDRITDLLAGDFDSDNKIDLIMAYNITSGNYFVGSKIRFIKGEGTLYFTAGNTIYSDQVNLPIHPEGPFNTRLEKDDFDYDGDNDLVISNQSGKIIFLKNNGATNFTASKELFDFGVLGRGITVNDIDNDQTKDIIIGADRKQIFTTNYSNWSLYFLKKTCPNGIIDQTEQCDDGNSNQSDQCSNVCTLTFCGDGILQSINGNNVAEQCDDGNLVSGDGCSSSCTIEPYYKVFTTLQKYPANFGGLSEFDNKCVISAQAIGFSSNAKWKAWISDSTTEAKERVYNSLDYSYRRVDGKIVANNWADLIDSSLDNPMNLTETGTILTPFDSSWTGTLANGTKDTSNCINWTTTSGSIYGRVGSVGSTQSPWTGGAAGSCNLTHHIYCFEQPWCGNRIIESDEQCDDGNLVDGDGCSAECRLEPVMLLCGNGVLNRDAGEECDDGNHASGDGCSFPECRIELRQLEPSAPSKNRYISFVPQNTGKQTAIRVKLKTLYDSTESPPRDANKTDLNAFTGEYRWVGQPKVFSEKTSDTTQTFLGAQLQCTPHFTDRSTTEELNVFGAEIVPSSLYEVQETAQECGTEKPECFTSPVQIKTSKWGDIDNSGSVTFTDISKLVDKFKGYTTAPKMAQADVSPNTPNQDVSFVDISAVVDAYKGLAYPYAGPASCTQATTALAQAPACGDGVLHGGEQCDDGNLLNGDGCDQNCIKEVCGNAYLQPPEQCDDGCLMSGFPTNCDSAPLNNGDGCDTLCRKEVCGNGILQTNEQCDDGNIKNGDGCSSTCKKEYCGDTKCNNKETCSTCAKDCGVCKTPLPSSTTSTAS